MIMMDIQEILRNILGSYRVQDLILRKDFSQAEASAIDFQFRSQLYTAFDYVSHVNAIAKLVPQDNPIDYRDDFGLHYLVYRGRDTETGSVAMLGPFTYRSYGEEDYRHVLEKHSLAPEAMEAIRWYFKRVPVIQDASGWRQMLSAFLSRYLANPDLEIRAVRYDHPADAVQRPAVSLSAISYASIEARYAVEDRMLEAIRRGDIGEATYQQNLFMGFALDQLDPDPLRDSKNMLIAVNTGYRKAIQQASVHPMYIDGISGQFQKEIEQAETVEATVALIPRMIRHYCLLVQRHSLEHYSRVVRDCLNYIDFHYQDSLSLEELAARFSVNKNYLSGRFHKEVGMTVTDYINRTRIERATALLGKTSLSVQEIAAQCGFEDANYFTRVFRNMNGMTPGEYRKSLKYQS